MAQQHDYEEAVAPQVTRSSNAQERWPECAPPRDTWRRSPITGDPDDLLLIEHHCPICEAAEACAGFCRAELGVFRAVLGDGVSVERTEHLLSGGARCAYRIRPVDAQESDPAGANP